VSENPRDRTPDIIESETIAGVSDLAWRLECFALTPTPPRLVPAVKGDKAIKR